MITEHIVRTERHTTFYLAAGPEDGPLVVLCHGWPELSLSWRHQLPALAALGFRAVAPDMRGYGRSSVYADSAAYCQEEIVADMIDLVDALGARSAVWVGHDWGSPVVWNVANHHPDRCRGVASLCVPYYTLDQGWDQLVSLVDRDVYPEDQYPVGQWDYMVYYNESLAEATAGFEADVTNTVRLLFRKGDPAGVGHPAGTAAVRANGGWFGGADAPPVPHDPDVVTEADVAAYAAALGRNGFFGPDSWYVNHDVTEVYGRKALNGGRLEMPVLFLHARYDTVCETVHSRLAEPMRERCANLTEHMVDSGHWMAQEKPVDVNRHLARWLFANGFDSPDL